MRSNPSHTSLIPTKHPPQRIPCTRGRGGGLYLSHPPPLMPLNTSVRAPSLPAPKQPASRPPVMRRGRHFTSASPPSRTHLLTVFVQ
ncbi:hypothetical protein GDO81_015334 [Engystomops pustulosus]|uniref:Uncharacterized protein n=1 Tax=Engystomops pustulosus TaxID=76066 RepID=A0AAV7ARI3_ENGPU|nr:hypothetical protein GDO81_015334 [Engystomops pustulosus]